MYGIKDSCSQVNFIQGIQHKRQLQGTGGEV
jgi:hypothetical protein